VEVEPYPKYDSLGVIHTPPAQMLPIMDFPKPHCISVDQNIEPYINSWASLVQNLKVHKKDPHVDIESSLNPMDPLQVFLLPKMWTVPTWESTEAPTLAPHLAVLTSHIHVQNLVSMNM
jgi:hypothetical protein